MTSRDVDMTNSDDSLLPRTYTESQFMERLRKFYPAVDTRITPLPTRWADSDECKSRDSL